MKRILSFLFLLSAFSVSAADRITATITIATNPVAGEVLVVNGVTRTWAATSSATTPLIGGNTLASITNLWQHLGSYPFTATAVYMPATNKVAIVGAPGVPMVVSLLTNWASISLSTQTVTSASVIRVPMSVEPNAARTNLASQLLRDLGAYSPTPMPTGTVAMSLFMDLVNTQTVTGAKTFSSIYTTGLVNRGSAISSIGTGTDSEQFGTSATATNTGALAVGQAAAAGGNGSMAIGNAATATATTSSAIGNASTATGEDSTAIGTAASASQINAIAVGSGAAASGSNTIAIGTSSQASGSTSIAIGTSAQAATNGIAVGNGAIASAERSIAIGQNSSATHHNSAVIGYNLNSLADNTMRIGNTLQTVTVNGILTVGQYITNTTYSGTVGSLSGGRITLTQIDGSSNYGNTDSNTTMNGTTDISGLRLPRSIHTTLANGANSGVIFTNTFNRLTNGPTSAFSIAGIASGTDGRVILIANMTGQNMTISHDSGTEATAGNRIYTMTGSDVATTGNGSAFLIYDSNLSRWLLLDSSP